MCEKTITEINFIGRGIKNSAKEKLQTSKTPIFAAA